MSSLALPLLVLIFIGCAAVIWFAGIRLSDTTDVLDDRLHLGSALGGVVLLAVATNLPEIAITVAAAASGNVGVAIGNILGGIAIQTLVLVALDAFGGKPRAPLTYQVASLSLVLEAALVIIVLTVTIMGSQLPSSAHLWRIEPAAVLIAVLWLAGVVMLGRARGRLPWQESGEAPDNQKPPQGHSKRKKNKQATDRHVSTGRAVRSSPSPRWRPWWRAICWNKVAMRWPITSASPACCSARPSWPQQRRCPSCRPASPASGSGTRSWP